MGTFQVQLRKTVDDSYEIEVGRSLMHQLADDLANGLLGGLRRFALITDSRVETLYAQPICRMLQGAGFDGEIFSFPAGEESKTRETKAEIEDRMLAAGFRRDCFVLAVGGGVVSDLAGFLAGTYGRGVPFIIYATTLLSAADASVGGKTAVDTPLATNLIGLFNQPKKAISISTAGIPCLRARSQAAWRKRSSMPAWRTGSSLNTWKSIWRRSAGFPPKHANTWPERTVRSSTGWS